MNRIELGVEVRDIASGFTGTAISRHEYLYGCERINIQPRVRDEDGKLPESQTFDAPGIEIISKGILESVQTFLDKVQRTGGPERHTDTGRR